MPALDAGLRGGENRSGECIAEGFWLWLRALIGSAGVGLGKCAIGSVVVFFVLDRRGGGRLGLGFSSTSSCSLADLKETGESAVWLDSMDVESLLWPPADRGPSCVEGLLCRGLFAVVVLIVANCMGFCLIGGDFIGSSFLVVKYCASLPCTDRAGGN